MSLAAVNPETGCGISIERRTAAACVGRDAVGGSPYNVGGHHLSRCVDKAVDLHAGERGDGAEGMDIAGEADLGLEDVAEAGHHLLVEEDVGHFLICARADSSCGIVL